MPSLFDWLKTVHVLGAIILMGPAFAYGVITKMGHRDPKNLPFASQVIARLSRRMFNPGLVIVLVSGILMGLDWGASFFKQGWVVVSLVIIVLTIAYSETVHRHDQRQIRRLAPQVAAAKEPDPAMQTRVAVVRRRLKIAGTGIAYAYGVVALLMVLKPF